MPAKAIRTQKKKSNEPETASPLTGDPDRQEAADRAGSLVSVRYLREHGLEKFLQQHRVAAHRHKTFPNLVQLRYRNDCNFRQAVCRECRGLILDESENWRPVAWPYAKFFNYREPLAAEIDWETATVWEKLDGSLCTVYFYAGGWHCASSGVPDGTGALGASTFSALFWDLWNNKLRYRLPDDCVTESEKTEARSLCYMFEMYTDRNRIICCPKTDRIALHGARDMRTLAELPPEPLAGRYGWDLVRSYPLRDLSAVLGSAMSLNPAEAEGFVVCDAKWNRVKVKSPQYVALSQLGTADASGANAGRILPLVRAHEESEFLAYFPEWSSLYRVVRARFDKFCQAHTKFYQQRVVPRPPRPYPSPDAIEGMVEHFNKKLCASLLVSMVEKGEPRCEALLASEPAVLGGNGELWTKMLVFDPTPVRCGRDRLEKPGKPAKEQAKVADNDDEDDEIDDEQMASVLTATRVDARKDAAKLKHAEKAKPSNPAKIEKSQLEILSEKKAHRGDAQWQVVGSRHKTKKKGKASDSSGQDTVEKQPAVQENGEDEPTFKTSRKARKK
eukprot:TRINITY_DN4141_c0_g1_i1.p1 TRINITY_DN4141_c0_g1~~TRINITY_DN4141_c0_g1_i1.p1  ORF type:complete len:560 (+),score=79.77 TRINITY_DN4141_c0_g1_i1:31-1710(+)